MCRPYRPVMSMFLLSALNLVTDACAQKLYWTTRYPAHVRRMNVDGGEQENIIANELYQPFGLATEPNHDFLYWSDYQLRLVGRVDKHSGEVRIILHNPNVTPAYLVPDPVASRLYWVDTLSGTIHSSSLDGLRDEVVLALGIGAVSELDFDSVERKLYWSNLFGELYRSNLDGTNVELVSSGKRYFELHAQSHSIFWLDSNRLHIMRSDLDFTATTQIISVTGAYASSLVVDDVNEKIYWIEHSGTGLDRRHFRASLDGTQLEEILPDTDASEVAVDSSQGKLYWIQNLPLNADGSRNPRIFSSNLDGSGVQLLVSNILPYTSRIQIDSASGKIYVSGFSAANLDGTELTSLFTLENTDKWAIDTTNQMAYWVGWLDDDHIIARSRLDGSNFEKLIQNRITNPVGVALDASNGHLYFSDYRGIHRANLDGSNIVPVIRDVWGMAQIAIDHLEHKIYWGEDGYPFIGHNGPLRRANLDGSNIEDVLGLSAGAPIGVAVDSQAGRVYWAGRMTVSSAKLDGSDRMQLPGFGLIRNATGVAVDPSAGFVYFAHRGQSGTSALAPGIYKTNVDFHSVELVTSAVTQPWGMAFDETNRWLYWADGQLWEPHGASTINRIHVDTLEHQVLIQNLMGNPWGIALDVDAGAMYWTDDGAGRLHRSSLDGSDTVTLAERVIESPSAIALDVEGGKMYWAGNPQIFPRGQIRRSDLDGTNIEELLPGIPGRIGDMVLDTLHQQIYWFDRLVFDNRIRRAGFDGSNVQEVVGSFEPGYPPMAVDPVGEKLYWTEGNYWEQQTTIMTADLDGTDQRVVVGGLSFVDDLAVNPAPHITSSYPPDCAIDARQPHDPENPALQFGWTSVELTFSGSIAIDSALNLETTESGGDGIPPSVDAITAIASDRLRIDFASSIEPGAWTCVFHVNSGTRACIGYLPGDVDGDGSTTPVDILRLIDGMGWNVWPPYELWQADIDRSGVITPSDLLRELELINGTQGFDPWLGITLPECP